MAAAGVGAVPAQRVCCAADAEMNKIGGRGVGERTEAGCSGRGRRREAQATSRVAVRRLAGAQRSTRAAQAPGRHDGVRRRELSTRPARAGGAAPGVMRPARSLAASANAASRGSGASGACAVRMTPAGAGSEAWQPPERALREHAVQQAAARSAARRSLGPGARHTRRGGKARPLPAPRRKQRGAARSAAQPSGADLMAAAVDAPACSAAAASILGPARPRPSSSFKLILRCSGLAPLRTSLIARSVHRSARTLRTPGPGSRFSSSPHPSARSLARISHSHARTDPQTLFPLRRARTRAWPLPRAVWRLYARCRPSLRRSSGAPLAAVTQATEAPRCPASTSAVRLSCVRVTPASAALPRRLSPLPRGVLCRAAPPFGTPSCQSTSRGSEGQL
jgi:hypothetical protein